LNKKTKKALQRELELYEFKKAEQAEWSEVRDANFEAGHISVLGHPAWNRISLVTPLRTEDDQFFHGEGNREWAEDLEGMYFNVHFNSFP